MINIVDRLGLRTAFVPISRLAFSKGSGERTLTHLSKACPRALGPLGIAPLPSLLSRLVLPPTGVPGIDPGGVDPLPVAVARTA